MKTKEKIMASRLRENQAALARLQRTVETLQSEANQPFITPETVQTFTAAAQALGTKIAWLEAQIAAETAAQTVTEAA
jgi:hypothetical protein